MNENLTPPNRQRHRPPAMVHGNMAVGVMGDDLIVRLGEQAAEAALGDRSDHRA
ncbi:hypothetical protein [Actinoplanes campanulatus]|uniref:hypothetical protein n=1 Tax=Actinoplanes campanulatus TaxID=113559 RepID=UPI001954E339|nr:hypothetical protein [Actinoplanes capillaceus]